jgi:tRNA (guanine37-N1)-methyltransferase
VRYTILTLFPEIVEAYFSSSIMAKAVERGLVSYRCINIRDFTFDRHHKCDDAPYGGGAGMLMLPEPLGRALEYCGAIPKQKRDKITVHPRVIYLSPSGTLLTQELVQNLAQETELLVLCGRYEGIDQRIIDMYVDDELSTGDYVLSSGEIAALVIIDATYRLVPGVISSKSLEEESFSNGLLEYPQYTRPEKYGMLSVPEILLSGHHERICQWRLRKRLEKTLTMRPDLIERGLQMGIFDTETCNIIEELQKSFLKKDPNEKIANFEGDTDE